MRKSAYASMGLLILWSIILFFSIRNLSQLEGHVFILLLVAVFIFVILPLSIFGMLLAGFAIKHSEKRKWLCIILLIGNSLPISLPLLYYLYGIFIISIRNLIS